MISCRESPGRGRGVFAHRVFLPGEIIEAAPVLVIPISQRPLIAATILDSVAFEWGAEGLELAIVLGFGSLYNHSSTPNAHYLKNLDGRRFDFLCVTRIEENEEIFINYNGNQNDSTRVVFEADNWKPVTE